MDSHGQEKAVEEEEEDEFIDDDEDAEIVDETFTCRICNKEVEVSEGDDMTLICDACAKNYNMDKFWGDYDDGKIPDDKLTTINMEPYKLPPKAPKKKKSTSK